MDPTIHSHNLFYWFFRHSDKNAPVVIWLNGGPGATSMFGLFLENGPIRVKKSGPGIDDFVITSPEQGSWADTYNMIYIDQPVGTGFSYGDNYLTDMQEGADEFLTFLREFYLKYPELKANRLFLTGESYAGKYLPLFTTKVLEWNEK